MSQATEARWPEVVLFAAGLLALVVGFGGDRGGARGFAPGPRAANTLRVLTWNVGGYAGTEAHTLADEDLEHAAAVLRELDPDLAFLQEVASREQGERLQAALGADWSMLCARRRSGRRVIALAPRGVLEPLGEPRGRRSAGRSRQAVLYSAPGGRRVAAVGLHASAFSASDRNEQVGEATNLLDTVPADWWILAGDLNLDLDLDRRRDLFSDDEYLDVETYNWVIQRYDDLAQGTGSTAEPDRRLDYVFGKGEGLQVEGAGPARGRRTGDMDHDPVVVDLR